MPITDVKLSDDMFIVTKETAEAYVKDQGTAPGNRSRLRHLGLNITRCRANECSCFATSRIAKFIRRVRRDFAR